MYHFLVNPSSCSGRGGKYWELIRTELDKRGVVYQVHFSEKPGDMARMVSDLTENEVHLIVLGGDGTVNEALQGIRDFKKTRFSHIPTGSSNDLARDTGISRDPVKALVQLLENGKEIPMDVGVVHYHTAYIPQENSLPEHVVLPKRGLQGNGLKENSLPDRMFLVSCGIGFDADVCQQAMSSGFKDVLNRLGLGKLTYLGIALKTILFSGRVRAVLAAVGPDGKRTGPVSIKRLMFAACMSHQYEGGGFRFCPGADASDGILDVCAVGNVPKWKVLLVFPTAFRGGHYRFQGVDRYAGRRIRIRTSRPQWVHTDGEVNALSSDITISCRPRLLRFYA